MKAQLRQLVLSLFRKVATHDEGRAAIVEALRGQLAASPPADLRNHAAPYQELMQAVTQPTVADRDDIIFITGRFRSGSTLLWNVFRQLPDVTAYYEPFNERRWFDPATRGDKVDATHRNVQDYWREYEGLGHLGSLYREDWIRRHLYMDESFWEPAMKQYIERLVEHAAGRPVLQFNRIDFRLPWIRRNFPHAKIVHIYRHPRDQWLSTFLGRPPFSPDGRMEDFTSCDGFYLRCWAQDLKFHFPFLDPRTIQHPYQLYYFIWKLSYLFGRTYAHHSFALEDLVGQPVVELSRLFESLKIGPGDLERVKAILSPPDLGKWRAYASDSWFASHESCCEETLSDFLGTDQPAAKQRTAASSAGTEASRSANPL